MVKQILDMLNEQYNEYGTWTYDYITKRFVLNAPRVIELTLLWESNDPILDLTSRKEPTYFILPVDGREK